MPPQNLLLLSSLIGLILYVSILRIPHRGKITLSNVDRGFQIGFIFLDGWVDSLALALVVFAPHNLFQFWMIAIVWLLMVSWVWLVYARYFRLTYFMYSEIGYMPVISSYWVVSIEQETTMEAGHPYFIKISLIERQCDVRLNFPIHADPKTPEGIEEIQEFFRKPRWLELRKFKEEAIVPSGNLYEDDQVTIVLSAPAFSLERREYQVVIDTLKTVSLSIPIVPQRTGNQSIAFDFFDVENQRCGGLVIPTKVRERRPILSERTAFIVQWTGGILSLLSAISIVLEKLILVR